MPPKKGEEEKKAKSVLGRPTNSVGIGIVGMPNIGKSSMFNMLSKLNVPAENFPFCTIDPNTAKVPVPDARFDFLVDTFKPKSVVPAVLTITDIAGLVKGANEGKGLGNAFLSNIQAVDAIYHLVRAFSDQEIEHVEGSVDPIRDLQTISEELILKDLSWVSTQLGIVEKLMVRGTDKTKAQDCITLNKAKVMLEEKKDIREGDWDGKDVEVLNRMQLLSAKPVVYLVNMSDKNFEEQKSAWLPKIKEWVNKRSPGAPIIPFSIKFESKMLDLEEEERKKYLKEKKLITMLPRIITSGYSALNLIYFFTSGEDEVRAWTIKAGTHAPQAAGTIHSDMEKGFIAAESMAYSDFKELGSEAAVKKAGKYKQQGKTYIVQDGDILFIKFNPPASGKAKAAAVKK